MEFWRRLYLRLRALIDHRSLDRDLDEELAFHLECETAANIDRGASAQEAARRAHLDFGHHQEVRELYRDIRGDSLVESLLQDVRYGWRMLRHNPVFTSVAAMTLALGIGANTAMFSVINAVLLRPLPYADPDRLVRIYDSNPGKGFPRFASSPPNFLDWREQAKSFSGMAALTWGSVTLTGRGDPQALQAIYVTPEFFPVFGVNAQVGRTFVAEEGTPNQRVVVLSSRLWQQSFGGRADLVGKAITLDGNSYNVVGVAPPSFRLYNADIFLPLAFDSSVAEQRGAHFLGVYARLKRGVSLQQANEELKTITGRLALTYPDKDGGWTAYAVPMMEAAVGSVRRGMLILFGAVAVLAIIACANVANLLLARSVTRLRELSVRAALGASRGRIIRQLLAECLLLCLLGGTVGLAAAAGCIQLLKKFGPADIPRLSTIRLDPTVLAFTAGLTLLCTFLFGILPALRASRVDLNVALKSAARGAVGGREWTQPRSFLIFGELSLSVMLLIGAFLLIRSFATLTLTPPGIDPQHVLTFNFSLPHSRYPKPEQIDQRSNELFARLRTLPQVQAAEGVSVLPLVGGQYSSSFEIRGKAVPLQEQPSAEIRVITLGYFQALHIPLLRGRGFTPEDNVENGPISLIVSETMARRFWPRGDALGQVIKMGSRPGASDRDLEGPIVGIVGDVRDFGLDVEPLPTVYSPFVHAASRSMSVVVRVTGDPAAVAPEVRSAVASIDPDLPLEDLQPMERVLATSLSQRRFYMFLLAVFATIALALVSSGLYGVIAYSVSQRTREFGVRMALGARRRQVLAHVFLHGMRLAAAGLAVGMVAAFAMRGVMSHLLVGISAADTIAFSAAAVVGLLVSAAACLVPALRATAVDPVVALRYE